MAQAADDKVRRMLMDFYICNIRIAGFTKPVCTMGILSGNERTYERAFCANIHRNVGTLH